MVSLLHKRLLTTCHLSLLSDYEWKSSSEWHYVQPYEAFKEKYPRISTGSPHDPWVVVQGNVRDSKTQKKSRGLNCFSTSSVDGVTPTSQRGDVQETEL